MTHPFHKLPPRGKPPATVRAIETWIQQAEDKVGIGAARVGWMVASNVVIAALQRARHADGFPRFLLKGGTYLELRLGVRARATKDVDTLFRGDFDEVIRVLDDALREPFDGVSFKRTEPTIIEVSGRSVKPRRLDVLLQLRGRTWRRITVEIAADEGAAGSRPESFPPPPLTHFGLTNPPETAGIAIDYQIAQKIHACTDPHSDEIPNERVRDVVDLHLLKSAFYESGDLGALARACRDIFNARAREAATTREIEPRSWPPSVAAHRHWQGDYSAYAEAVGLDHAFEEAVGEINAWIDEIHRHE